MSDDHEPKKPTGDPKRVDLSARFIDECKNRCTVVSAFERNGKYSLVFSGIDVDNVASLDAFIKERSDGFTRQCEGDVVQYTMPVAAFEKCVGVQSRRVAASH